jgi:hypothetical protein
MTERETAGEPITTLIQDIADLAATDPVAFAGQIGGQLIHLDALTHQPKEAPEAFAERVGVALELPIGARLTTTANRLTSAPAGS